MKKGSKFGIYLIVFIISLSCVIILFVREQKQQETCLGCYVLNHSKLHINNHLAREGVIEIGENVLGKDKYWVYFQQIKDSVIYWKDIGSKILPIDSGQFYFWNVDSTLLINRNRNEIRATVYFSVKLNSDSLTVYKRKLKEYDEKIKSGDYDRTLYLGQEIITEKSPDPPLNFITVKLRFALKNNQIVLYDDGYIDIERYPITKKFKSSNEKEIIYLINQFSNYAYSCQTKFCFSGIP